MTGALILSCLDAVDPSATSKSFNFASKRNLDFHYVSAAEGTNVVKVRLWVDVSVHVCVACVCRV